MPLGLIIYKTFVSLIRNHEELSIILHPLSSNIHSAGGWYLGLSFLSSSKYMYIFATHDMLPLRIFTNITLSGLFLVSTAPTAPPRDLPNTTILDVSMSVL